MIHETSFMIGSIAGALAGLFLGVGAVALDRKRLLRTLVRRADRQEIESLLETRPTASADADARLQRIEQVVADLARDMDRIEGGQRLMTKLLTDAVPGGAVSPGLGPIRRVTPPAT
jgi:hypothetical protein